MLERLKYCDHRRLICVDLKMVNFLLGKQGGHCINIPVFYATGLWNTRSALGKQTIAIKKYYETWRKNINNRLVDRKNIIPPPLRIKLGLMKQLVKALECSGDCFDCMLDLSWPQSFLAFVSNMA